jgi:hypothetical protein
MVETLKQEAQRLLADVPGECVFWVNDGQVLHNMKELGEGLKTMSDDTYIYHANKQKHDFYNWVNDVIGDETLAANLREALTRTQAIRAVSSRINILSKRLA